MRTPPPDGLLRRGKDLSGSQCPVLRRVPLCRHLWTHRRERLVRRHPATRAEGATSELAIVAADGPGKHRGLPAMCRCFRAAPPDDLRAARPHVLGPEVAVSRRVPLTCDIRVLVGEGVARRHPLTSAERTVDRVP